MSEVQAKTYSGGQTLPALTADYQAVPVGRNVDGELVPEQRAFVATVRNRSDGDMFVKEGNGDGIRIDPGESYVVMRTDGTSQINLKGANVGTDYEIRTVEAHNDFSLTDRIEGFAQSVSALLQSSRRNTHIVGSDVTLDTSVTSATATLDTDISAQSIGDIAIDINNQSVGSIDDRMVSDASLSAETFSATNTVSGDTTVSPGESESVSFDATFSVSMFTETLSGESYFEYDITPDSGGYSVDVEFVVAVNGGAVVDLGTVLSISQTQSSVSGSDTDTYEPTGVAYIADNGDDVTGTWVVTFTADGSNGADMTLTWEFTGEHTTNTRAVENN